MVKASQIVRKAQFAQLEKVSKARVTQWAKAGMPVRSDGFVDVDTAREWLQERRAQTKGHDSGSESESGAAEALSGAVDPNYTTGNGASGPGTQPRGTLTGQPDLLPRSEVEEAAEAAGRRLKELCFEIPDRLADKLAMRKSGEIRKVIDGEIRGVLQRVSDEFSIPVLG